MGIADFFRKKSVAKIEKKSSPSMPTVPAPQSLFPIYAEVFRREMATIQKLAPNTIETMLKFIESGDGGFLNRSHYHKEIFDKYFKEQDWIWPEYEKWREISLELGRWPLIMGQLERDRNTEKPNTQSVIEWRLELYRSLMHTIHGRAIGINNAKRSSNLGFEGRLLPLPAAFAKDQKFIDIALAENPKAIPPLFPGDFSVMTI